KVIAVLGGSGFLGRYVVQHFTRLGALVKVGCRHLDRAMHLQPMGDVGQIKFHQVNIRDDHSVAEFIAGSDVVINLVGILFEKGKQTFEEIHCIGAKRVATLSTQLNVSQLIHISALGADPKSSSHYARTKAEGEREVFVAFPRATIVRPSILIGPEDQFFQKFAAWTSFSPALPLLGGGTTLFQPIYVGDVADALVLIAQKNTQHGEIIELGGPKVYTFRELLNLMLTILNRRRLLIPVPKSLGYVLAAIGQMLPHPPLTIDQIRLLSYGSVVSGKHKTIADLGLHATDIEVLLPKFLNRFGVR
ncbi:MAG TPA: complex I NDUFA9 subunit family protein, partial [Candidatus Nitrosotenuis sp.]|nr:complex I NDUFA9 subunit family protein [Candidatus Nitrosotenuis sp.]